MAEYKNQHTVPQLYLREFRDSFELPPKYSENMLWRLDQKTATISPKGIENICSESYYYYRTDSGECDHEIEKKLGALETGFKKVFDQIVNLSTIHQQVGVFDDFIPLRRTLLSNT